MKHAGSDVAGFGKHAKDATRDTGLFSKSLHGLSGMAKTALKGLAQGVGIAGGIAAARSAVSGFVATSAGGFARVGGEILTLQRYTGGTAEEMSKLRFIAQESGVDVNTLSRGLGLLSKRLAKETGPNAQMMGVHFRTATGAARPLNDIILDLAGQFQKMPNGVEKTNAVLTLFGRGGANMLRVLNRGKAGLVELEDEAKKYGLVLTNDNLKAVQANIMAHRQYKAAMEGFQVQVGMHVLPVLTSFMRLLTTGGILPAMHKIGGAAKTYLGPALQWAFGVIVTAAKFAVAWFRQNWPAISVIARTVFGHIKSIMQSLATIIRVAVVPIMDMLVSWLKKAYEHGGIVFTTFGAIDAVLGFLADHASVLAPIMVTLLTVLVGFKVYYGILKLVAFATKTWAAAQAALNVIMAINPVVLVVIAVVALAAGMIYAYHHSERFRHVIQAVWGALRGVVVWIAGAGKWIGRTAVHMWDGIKNGFRAVINWIIRAWNGLEFKVPGFKVGPVKFGGFTLGMPDIPELWAGGTTTTGGMVSVGERGQEYVYLPPAAVVQPAPTAGPLSVGAAMGGTGHGGGTQIVQLVVDRKVLAEVALAGVGDKVARR